MIVKFKNIRIGVIFILVACGLELLHGQQYTRLKAGIHFDSQVSGGKYSLAELARIIGESDLDVAIITDHDNMHVRYGNSFFRRAFQLPVNRHSIATYGVEKYFNRVNYLNNFYPDVEIIPGIEAVPYYSWDGSLLSGNLILKNWHRHLLVFGLDDVSDYKKLPSIKTGFPVPGNKLFRLVAQNYFYYLVIGLILLITIWLIIVSLRRKKLSKLSVLLLLLLGYILIAEYPYAPLSVSPYKPETARNAYQYLIDYVKAKQGLVFWAHPEAAYEEHYNLKIPFLKSSVYLKTDKYSHLVYETNHHDGFAGFWEGMKVLGKPGGLWDMQLQEYCNGLRPGPMFTIGELDFEETNDLKLINETNTFIFAKNRSKPAIFEALKQGRMYATREFIGNKLVIDEFRAYDLQDESSALMGETLKIAGSPIAIHLKITVSEKIKNQALTLYRNTVPIKQFVLDQSIDEWIVDKDYPKTGKFYYKVYGGKDFINLVTNPIFVENQ